MGQDRRDADQGESECGAPGKVTCIWDQDPEFTTTMAGEVAGGVVVINMDCALCSCYSGY